MNKEFSHWKSNLASSYQTMLLPYHFYEAPCENIFYDDIIALEVSVESSFVYIFGMVSRSSLVLKSHDLLGVKNKKKTY